MAAGEPTPAPRTGWVSGWAVFVLLVAYTLAFVVINFAIDMLYALIDPRIRFGK